MKRVLSCILCALWLLVLFGPRSLFSDEESRLVVIIFVDILLLVMLIWLITDWRKRREDGILPATFAFALATQLILPPLTGNLFFIVAILPMGIYFGVVIGHRRKGRRGQGDDC